MKIKTGDKVEFTTGKNKGKSGKVVQVFLSESKLVVDGLNIIKKHMRSNKRGEKGQIIELAGPVDVSKVVLLCPKCGAKAKVGYKVEGKTKKRFCKKCSELID
ncbi:MAG: 50S ribosomal protein L24 [Candidatus Magasanikbacteria bacterium CG10_big_fil_rev_8_21_14_0_10_40_10]|uniref:Large ribosomal subunit protein uL24 n=1 Tax=Candidatus Magasanikbacteria bacterium CG10_big_fil_rev_8_21_14_0_10_40_10 TaxID=1974648 RepID=A0A2M6W578_9BACT|nr:MAG: 50S ribosomal protein L24 [Candidatus Magasanikbacteria bacterium CG10_big_fil_rev_8_21_14_0_10_40_10]